MTRRAAVLGHPISHSLSPVLHTAAYRALGLNWSYTAIDVTVDEVGEFLSDLDDSWVGLSVTAPLKQAVQPWLADVSPLATQVGAVNTILCRGEGAARFLVGDNTDVAGIVSAVGASRGDRAVTDVGIVGAGGTAAAALVAAESMTTGPIELNARRPEAVAELLNRVPVEGATAGEWQHVDRTLARDLVIVTLPGDAAAPLAAHVPAHPGMLLDVTYHPWPTALAAAWQDRGGVVVPGHQMLLWQAVRQVELMTGMTPPAGAMARALTEALAAR